MLDIRMLQLALAFALACTQPALARLSFGVDLKSRFCALLFRKKLTPETLPLRPIILSRTPDALEHPLIRETARLVCLSVLGLSIAATFASSGVMAGGVFYKDRAEPLLIISQPKSVLLRKVCDLCFVIFFSDRPDALQFLLVDSAVPQIVSLELQFTSD